MAAPEMSVASLYGPTSVHLVPIDSTIALRGRRFLSQACPQRSNGVCLRWRLTTTLSEVVLNIVAIHLLRHHEVYSTVVKLCNLHCRREGRRYNRLSSTITHRVAQKHNSFLILGSRFEILVSLKGAYYELTVCVIALALGQGVKFFSRAEPKYTVIK